MFLYFQSKVKQMICFYQFYDYLYLCQINIFYFFYLKNIYLNNKFVEQGYNAEKLLTALNKLAQGQALHPQYILYIWWYYFILLTHYSILKHLHSH